ncbi:S-adenosyl-L-methionine-dependent methyltransferase [Phaeosphaeria sp. MPI-PUGE-AT-0046c]|nr:S-adenosyl-L-methionine-dependent methyltransferase [Phaeosphaeria sp. MPI-PUGE-AT-0046c]
MTVLQWIGDHVPTFLRPAILLLTSAYHFFMTILEIVFLEWRPFKLFNLTTVRFQSFARLWKNNGEAMSAEMPGPTFELLSRCKGVILDIGPGSGEMLSSFNPEVITALYGAEPAKDLHPGLVKNAAKRGFSSNFHPLLCGAEPESLIPALHQAGIIQVSGKGGSAEDGVFDEICCTRVLCGVPHPQQTIKSLYSLLKPGGRMVICEHVVSPWRTDGAMLARLMQVVYTLLGWPFFMGGCELQRHTPEYLRDAGEWDQFELKYYGPKDTIPFVVGELIKKHGSLDKSYAEAVKE